MLVSSKDENVVPSKRIFDNFDIRDSRSDLDRILSKHGFAGESHERSSNALELSMKAAQSRLERQRPNVDVEWNVQSGAPEIVGVLSSRQKLTGRSGAKREDIVRRFLSVNNDLYGLSRDQIAELKTTADYVNPSGNMSFVELEQQIAGIPVFQGNLRAGLTRSGELIRTTGLIAPGLDYESLARATNAFSDAKALSESAANAVVAGAGSVGVEIDPADLAVKESGEGGTSVVFELGPLAKKISVKLVYFPLQSGAATLSWSMVLMQGNPSYYALVDAGTGDLLWRKNISSEQSETATYSVYNDDSPAPFSPYPYLPGAGIQAPFIPRTTFTHVSELPAFNDLGWIPDGVNTTTGNNVDAGLNLVAPLGIDPDGRPTGSPYRVFDFPYDPAVDEPTNPNYRAGAVTNLFFWSNRYHDVLYQYGFTEPARNFQNDNFGRGGLGGDRMITEAQDYQGTNNAYITVPPDGSSADVHMFLWTGPTPDHDGDLDQEVIIHELTHGTSSRLHNDASGLTATISRGMGEGWSDFYPRLLLSSADEDIDGNYAVAGRATYLGRPGYTDNYYYGIRSFPWAVKTSVGPNGKPHNPMTLADIDPNTFNITDGAFPLGPYRTNNRLLSLELYNSGNVWSVALHEVRARLIRRLGFAAGNARMLQLTTDAMKLDPANPTHLLGRDSFLAADVAFGSEDALDIWAGFAARGMGFGATIAPGARLTSGSRSHIVKESFDNPIPGMGTVTMTDNACGANGAFGVGEKVTLSVPLTNPLTNEITNVSAQVTGGGSAIYGTIAPGATATRNIAYQVPANVACGSKIDVNVVVTSDLGTETKTFKLQVGTPTPIVSENFDGVTAPSLPAGWSAQRIGGATWSTSTIAADTSPNAAMVTFASAPGTSRLSFASVVPATGGQLSFRHLYNTEFLAQYGRLLVSINSDPYLDILDAGGTFETGGYNWVTNWVTGPRGIWTGNSDGFITTTVTLPASANGKHVVFRFEAQSNGAVTVPDAVWLIDSVVLNGFICPPAATTTTVNASVGQYSDATSLSATLAADCDYPEGSMEFRVDGNLVGTAAVSGNGSYSTPYTITDSPGNHTIAVAFVSSNPYFAGSSGTNTLAVSKEDGSVQFPSTNPFSVKVNAPGGTAGPITICSDITEVPDGSAGDTANATATFTITPVAGGTSPSPGVVSYSGGGVGGTRKACITLNSVAVDVYDITVTVGDYYQGTNSTVLAIYDPSLGFVTGGGTVVNNGRMANFGISVKYLKNGKPQGSVLYIERRPDGNVKIKSNSMQSLSIVGNTAVLLTKATVNGIGNYSVRLTLVDNGEPGSSDQFGLRTTSPSNTTVPDLTFANTTISGGNISVPRPR